jgi:hypothetical protein
MRKILHDLWRFLEPEGSSSRVFIGLYMLVSGVARIFTGNSVTGDINVFSARMFGWMLVLGSMLLLVSTRYIWRCHWFGRISAIICSALWLLLIANAWSAHAWVSISGAFVFVLALGNEVRIHEC